MTEAKVVAFTASLVVLLLLACQLAVMISFSEPVTAAPPVPTLPDNARDFLYNYYGADWHCVRVNTYYDLDFECDLISEPTPGKPPMGYDR